MKFWRFFLYLPVLIVGCQDADRNLVEKIPLVSNQCSNEIPAVVIENYPGIWKTEIPRLTLPKNIDGTVVSADVDSLGENFVVQTMMRQGAEKYFHIYLFRSDNRDAIEIKPFPGKIIKNPRFVKTKDTSILFEIRQPTALYFKSELALYNVAAQRGNIIGTGYAPQVSPDDRVVVFNNSSEKGFHNVHMWDAESDRTNLLFSYSDTDPGSGPTVFYRFSSCSKFIYFQGTSLGFTMQRDQSLRRLNFIYAMEQSKFCEININSSTPNPSKADVGEQ